MKKELFVSSRGNTHAVALTEGGVLAEFNSESDDDASIVGNIYKGKIEQIVKGMQAAFVNIGRNKNAYLFYGDAGIAEQEIAVDLFDKKEMTDKVGDEIMVQVTKTEIGTKGARLTTNVSIAGRFLVYMPTVSYVGISRKIIDEKTREELIKTVEEIGKNHGGFIIRTAAGSATKEEIEKDAERLFYRWDKVLKSYDETPPTNVCYKEGGILYRAIRDLIGSEIERVTVDNVDTQKKICEYMKELGLDENKVSLFHKKDVDLFNYYGLTAGILRVLDSKVELENGAYLVIENTEALTVIDVNTGKYVGNDNLEDTVFETNMLAAKAVAAQIRLRNIGGIIVVDFIDMASEEHNAKLLESLAEYVKKDRVRTTVVEMTKLGLVEITRKKSRTEVKQKLSKPCKVCGGKGYVMTNETLASLVKERLFDIFSDENATSALVILNTENANEFFSNRALTFEISVFWQQKRIYVSSNDNFGMDKYEIKAFYSDVIDIPENAKLLY